MNPLSTPDYEAILPLHIDSTMLSSFRSCPRKFYHEYILGLRTPETKVDLYAGAALASALEEFYTAVHTRGASASDALKEAFVAFSTSWGDNPKEPLSDSPKSFDRMWEAVADYLRVYPPHTDHIQPYTGPDGKVTSEFSFAIPLDPDRFPGMPLHPMTGEPFIYCGRFDMLGSYLGRPCVRDEKTTKYAGATWADQWDLRAQFMGYVWACQQSGFDLDTVVVRGIVIQKTQIKQLEAIKIYPQYMVDRWYRQLKYDLNRLHACWLDGYFDYNFGESCTSYSGCTYRSICRSAKPEAWMQEYRVLRWNPLARSLDTPDMWPDSRAAHLSANRIID